MHVISKFEPTDGKTVWMDSNEVNAGECLMDGCRVQKNTLPTTPPCLSNRGL